MRGRKHFIRLTMWKRNNIKTFWLLALLSTLLCIHSSSLGNRLPSLPPQLIGVKQIKVELGMVAPGIGFRQEDLLELTKKMVNTKLPFLKISNKSNNILHVEFMMDIMHGLGDYSYYGILILQLKRPVFLLDKKTSIKRAIVWERGMIFHGKQDFFESVRKTLGVLIDKLAIEFAKTKRGKGKGR